MRDGNTNDGGLTWPWVAAFAALAVLHRLVPYLFDLGPEARFAWNFAPVGALGLFAGARWRSPLALLAPAAVMLVSNLLMWPFLAAKGYSPFDWGTPIIFLSFTAYALIGRSMSRSSAAWVTAAPFVGALQFFLVTNFAVWLGGDGALYAKNLAGLTQCYVAGLPFFPNTLGGDLAFSVLFFGAHGLSLAFLPRLKASQPA